MNITKELMDAVNQYLEEHNVDLRCDVEHDSELDTDCLVCEVHDGDWKHEHAALRYYIQKYFDEHPDLYLKETGTRDYEGSDGDWYSQTYMFYVDNKANQHQADRSVFDDLDDIDDTVEESLDSEVDDEPETDFRYYVYDDNDSCVSDGFGYQDDAEEFALEHNYPVVKIHRYYRDFDGELNPDGNPEVVWKKVTEGFEEKICCICNNPFRGYGNNAAPVAEGVCCDMCNLEKVIPARFARLKGDLQEDLLTEERNGYSYRGYTIYKGVHEYEGIWFVKDPSGNRIPQKFESDREAEKFIDDSLDNN